LISEPEREQNRDGGEGRPAVWVSVVVFAVLLGLIPAVIGRNKGENFWFWWLFGTLLFVVALPWALVMKPNAHELERQALREGMTKCPQCAELVKAEAVRCRFCGADLFPIPPLPKERGIDFTHAGRRYLFGVLQSDSAYGIWDTTDSDGLIEAFSEKDWEAAWDRFTELEPEQVELV
jgi:hypothetical protein